MNSPSKKGHKLAELPGNHSNSKWHWFWTDFPRDLFELHWRYNVTVFHVLLDVLVDWKSKISSFHRVVADLPEGGWVGLVRVGGLVVCMFFVEKMNSANLT